MRARLRAAAVVAAALAGCGGATGTFSLELVTAPGSTVLADITLARLTLSVPYRQVEAPRDPDGTFHLSREVPAEGPTGQVTFEGFDDGGDLVAWGRSGFLPIAAVDASVAIYVAPPLTLGAAQTSLDPPRTDIGVARFNFGVLLVGGADASGAPTDQVELYDVYEHELLPGEDAPGARAGAVVGAGASGYAYVFGGRGPAGTTGTFWRFDTTVTPAGQWLPVEEDPVLARTGAAIAPARTEVFVVTGTPPLVLDGLSLSVSPLTNSPPLAGTATALLLGNTLYDVVVGEGTGTTGIVTIGPEGVEEHGGAPSALRTGHGAAGAPGPKVVVLGGAVAGVPTSAAVVARPATSVVVEIDGVLATPRTGAAVAGNGVVAIVAGGRDASGALLGDCEVIDLESLGHVATIPMVVPRTGAIAATLASGQILVLGGVDDAGAPVGTIEVFNPPAPAQP